jgi:hypothetical protein
MKPCNQCVKCCIHYSDGGLSATTEEIEGWQLFNSAIAEHGVDGNIWMDPFSGEQLTRCPWLEELPADPGQHLLNMVVVFIIMTAPRIAGATRPLLPIWCVTRVK